MTVDLDGRRARLPNGAGIAGRGHLELHAEGTLPDRIAVRSRGHLSALRLGTLQLGTLRLDADARVDARDGAPPGTRSLSSRGKVDVMGLSVGRTRVRTGNLRFDLRGTVDAPSGGLTMSARDVVLAPDAPKIDSFALDARGSRGGMLAVRAAVSGPRLRGGMRAHGSATAAAADVTLDGLSLDVTTTAYRQKLDLERPARIRYRAGEEIAVEHLALRGAGARFTGEAVLDAAYRLPPARRDPLARLALELRHASVGGLPPTDARLAGDARPGAARRRDSTPPCRPPRRSSTSTRMCRSRWRATVRPRWQPAATPSSTSRATRCACKPSRSSSASSRARGSREAPRPSI